MPQCENHEHFMQVALNYGWELWEYGIDSTCEVGGPKADHLALIWLKPCAWDEGQKVPVGCICCTDLNEELLKHSEEIFDVIESRRMAKGVNPEEPLPTEPTPLAERPAWMKAYRAR